MARLAPILLFFSLTAAAQEVPWYTVELLVFERTDPGGLAVEHWRDDPGFPDLEGAHPLTRQRGGSDEPYAFRLLGPDELMLTKMASRLKRSENLAPLLHLAWRQPGLDRAESKPVHIRSDRNLRATNAAEPPRRTRASRAGQAPTWAGGAEGLQDALALEGTLRLYRSRYLHVDVDLRYFRPSSGEEPPAALDQDFQTVATTAPGTPGEQGTMALTGEDERLQAPVSTHFRLREHRRMRSKETHYFDHPLFGIVMQVTPYEPPAPKLAPAAAQPAPTGQEAARSDTRPRQRAAETP